VLVVRSIMAKLTDIQKVQLQEADKWQDFIAYRDRLKAAGHTPTEYNGRAIATFFRSDGSVVGTAPKGNGTPAPTTPDLGGDTLNEDPDTPPTLPEVTADVFHGKTASEAENIRWVAANMMVADVTSDDCPSGAAWWLLSMCRRSPTFEYDFAKSMYTKLIPTRSMLESMLGGESDEDGVPQIETIGKVLEISIRTQGGSAVTTPGSSPGEPGSSPGPATTLPEASP